MSSMMQPAEPSSLELGQKVEVMLLEDRHADARLIKHSLAEFAGADFHVTAFVRLLPALDYLRENTPDIIVADLNVPDSSGLETYHQLHRASPVIPLVIMTAQTDSQLGIKAVDAGAQDFLVKGELESQSLGRVLLQAIARQNLRQSMASHLRDVESSHTRLHNLVDLNIDGMLILDSTGRVIFVNRRAEELFGRSRQQLVNQMLGRPVADETGRRIEINDGHGGCTRVHMRMQTTGWDNHDAYMVLLSKLDESSGTTPTHSSQTLDNVTDLFSRTMFYEQSRICLQHARRQSLSPAMLCVNLDNFRRINEAMGHGWGDELLRVVGTRIRGQLRAGDIVGRFSGDEFLVLLAPLRRSMDADAVAGKIMQTLAQPLEIWNQELRVTARVGISIFPHDGVQVEDLVSHAQVAGQRAKKTGGSHVHYYTHELTERSERRFNLEQQLRRALPQQQFDIAYQPIVDVRSNTLTGVEALLRWHPEHDEAIGPAEFVPILEETGLISGVGEWVLRKSCQQIRAWRDQGVELRLSVNISPLQFESPRLLPVIESALSDSRLPAHALVLELTESVLMRNIEASIATLNALRAQGVSVAIDDFGTGFSSLNYLKRFAIDSLKIDKAFIRDIMLEGHDAAITRATIDLAHNLGLQVTAEGVETAEQLAFLKYHGCDNYQGFLFSEPVTPESILKLPLADASSQ